MLSALAYPLHVQAVHSTGTYAAGGWWWWWSGLLTHISLLYACLICSKHVRRLGGARLNHSVSFAFVAAGGCL
jgi:hypothetical protein